MMPSCLHEALKQTPAQRPQPVGRSYRAAVHRQNNPAESVKDYLARIGRKGGLKGGDARAKKLSPERRKAIAKKAAQTR